MGLSDASAAEAVRQVEFYLGDSNLPRDKFLLGIIQAEGNAEQWVELNVIAAFVRMRAILKTTATQPDAVSEQTVSDLAEALRKGSSALTISEDGTRVRRNTPLENVEAALVAADKRSLYAAPFPYNATMEQLTEFFGRQGPVACVRLRRHLQSKDSRGSAFVEFDSEETAQKVCAMELEYEGAPLRLMPKNEFVEQKISERHARTNSPHNKDAPCPPAEETFEEGLVLFFKWKEGEEGTEAVTREQVSESFGGSDSGVAFVKYSRGASEGFVRFQTPAQAKAGLDSAGEEKEKLLGGKTALVSAVEGEDEKKFWKEAAEAKRNLRQKGGRGGGRGGGRSRGDHKRQRHY